MVLSGSAGDSVFDFTFGTYHSRVEFVGRADTSTETLQPFSPDLVVADQNTGGLLDSCRLFETSRFEAGQALPEKTRPVLLEAGEANKNFQSIEKILTASLSAGLRRGSSILGLGGGVVCDLTAFAASIYMRGVDLILVPTSLLAMVDAALGGKTGFDFKGYKNLIGTFYPASRIIINTGFVSGLPEREYRSGLAEVIKSGLLQDPDLIGICEDKHEEIEKREPAVVDEVVRRSIQVKGRIVEEDFREAGRRGVLNLGHTFGHALESATGFSSWSHGEAVAWGITAAMEFGRKIGITGNEYADKVIRLLGQYGFPQGADVLKSGEHKINSEKLVEAMAHDKKNRSSLVRLVLQRGPLDTFFHETEPRTLISFLDEFLH
ncbi:MAG: 3-dehydroquinate synthase [Spirochaetales bacterium]|nr:3-dehydroquinate synthase [Spirochaetales bacterium]MCF7937169.1 3-dehydroquinate synthase [Spirochaetales bacterium]